MRTSTKKILRLAFTSVHKDEFIAIEQQPAGIGQSVATSIIRELGDLLRRRCPAQREFKRALHLCLDSVRLPFKPSGEMFALARDERAVPQRQGLLHCNACRTRGGELIASRAIERIHHWIGQRPEEKTVHAATATRV